MTAVGLRERKKEQTRLALIRAAARLFEEKGYEATTVAEIAAGAGVSTKTLFNYFAGKEELVFSNSRRRGEEVVRRIVERDPAGGESLAEVLGRVADPVGDVWSMAGDSGADPLTDAEIDQIRQVWLELVMTVPELQAKALGVMFEIERGIIAAIRLTYPNVDIVTASAAVGAMIGSVQTTMLTCLEGGGSLADARTAGARARQIAINGVGSIDELIR